ncbi:MAG: hypothetical protein GTO41_18780, partial [Burkholderiales bacterium]|nr:hypothetical protein [Burkholderiales bacterium]
MDNTLEKLDVVACFDGAVPPKLVADDTGMLFLKKMQLQTPGGELEVIDWQATLSGVPDDACVEYLVHLRP